MLVALLANLFSCNNPTQPPVIQNVELKVNDATATEVFLEITTSNVTLPVSATLNKDGTLLQNITLVNANTTIVDKSLSPNKNYTYQVIININGKQVTSSSVPAQTMDTTSHNFTWQTFTFGGQAGSSTLYDVAIINENNIWGVGPGGTIVHYDGSKWTKIDFDQQWRFDAITGSEKTGVAYASATDQAFNTAIVELKDNSANIIYYSSTIESHLTAYNLKMVTDSTLYLSNLQVWVYNIRNNVAEIIGQLPGGYFLPLIGSEKKIDSYFFGSKYQQGDYMVHYNGKRLKEFPIFGRTGTIYGGAYAIKDLAIMVGESNNTAYLVEVKRR